VRVRRAAVALTAVTTTAAAATAVTVAVRANSARRARVARAARVWRLTARNTARYAAVRMRGVGASEHRRARLNESFAIRTAQDVADELGQMKGALMKAGQLLGFIVESLPEEAQRALSALQADAPPMAPDLAVQVVTEELGPPERIFLDWSDVPVAAASVGQVHRAVTRDGRVVAVKVQYPGVGEAIGADLSNAEMLYAMLSSFTLKGLDTKALVDELRARMLEELDYNLEARNQQEFVTYYEGHPFIRVPAIVSELSSRRVITSEWVDGLPWAEFQEQASPSARQRAGEIIWRFAQHSVIRLGAFNGDPHPGNYRFDEDGSVTFLDFGLVKRWTAGEWERLAPSLRAILARDPDALIEAMEDVRFIERGHGLDPAQVFDYVSAPYRPYLSDRFTFTRDYVRDTIAHILDVRGPHAAVIERLNLPPSFVILDRVVWGVSALLGKLEATGPWRAMIHEYVHDRPPATPLGESEHEWMLRRRSPAGSLP
jgi:predicted unusual protein kinase regulating ubiquinone biosynthesis (AarF/ABC1/UbiB family)